MMKSGGNISNDENKTSRSGEPLEVEKRIDCVLESIAIEIY